MSAPEFTTEEMIQQCSHTAGAYDYKMQRSVRKDGPWKYQAAVLRAIAARLSDPWSAFAGWQPPPEAERADGYRCWGYVPGLCEQNDDGAYVWTETPFWCGVTWRCDPDLDSPPVWVSDFGDAIEPTAFAPLPPPPKETTDVER